MPEQTPSPTPLPPRTPSSKAKSTAGPKAPTIHIADEFGTAKRNLPPIKILLMALAGVLLIAGMFAFLQRAKPQAAGTLDNVSAVQIPNQTASLVALTFTLHSVGEKPLWVHGIQAKTTTSSGEQTSDAVSAVDFDRYYQAFPALKAGAQPALSPEDKLPTGQELKRTVIVSFPVTVDEFNQRKSVSVIIQPYDQPVPIIMTK
jgi:hypothetical protein